MKITNNISYYWFVFGHIMTAFTFKR